MTVDRFDLRKHEADFTDTLVCGPLQAWHAVYCTIAGVRESMHLKFQCAEVSGQPPQPRHEISSRDHVSAPAAHP